MRVLAFVLTVSFLGAGCTEEQLGPVADPPAVSPLAGIATGEVLVVSSESTSESLAVLSLDTATGELGMLPGSPAALGAVIGDAETLAADPVQRRVFFGGANGVIAVCELDATGMPVPVAGSPFPAELAMVSVVKVAPSGTSIYVGYHNANRLSRYDVGVAGDLILGQSISTGASAHVETMLRVGDVLYVGFNTSSNIVGYRLDAQDAFADDGQGNPVVVTNMQTGTRPDYLAVIGDKLYCSLAGASDGNVDAFQIEADGSLTRLAGAPYGFPGMGAFELISVQPGEAHIAVGAETPSARVGVYVVNGDGSLTAAGAPLVMHDRKGGPEGMEFSANGQFLYVCDHVGQGLYVFELNGSDIDFAATPRYQLPGRQIDVLRLDIAVNP